MTEPTAREALIGLLTAARNAGAEDRQVDVGALADSYLNRYRPGPKNMVSGNVTGTVFQADHIGDLWL